MNPIDHLMVSAIQLLPSPLVKPFAMRYIAGETLNDAVSVVRRLNTDAMMGTLDVLGENSKTKEDTLLAAKACEQVLHAIDRHHLNANLSVKLTQLGLQIDQELCHFNVRKILEIAKGYKNFVRIDMEDSSTTSATLELYERIRSEGFGNTGVVIQASLRRSESDVKRLIETKANVRLCKGAYVEPKALAFKSREEIRLNYLKLLRMLLGGKCYVGIATHDDFLVDGAYQSIQDMKLQKAEYEFQMLLGVKPNLRRSIVADGHRLRVYVPFGEHWSTYSLRRFQENPRMARYIVRALFSRKE